MRKRKNPSLPTQDFGIRRYDGASCNFPKEKNGAKKEENQTSPPPPPPPPTDRADVSGTPGEKRNCTEEACSRIKKNYDAFSKSAAAEAAEPVV